MQANQPPVMWLTINYHGGIHSHMDGVAHFGWRGSSTTASILRRKKTESGAGASVGTYRRPRHLWAWGFGRSRRAYTIWTTLKPGAQITREHTEAWEASTGTTIQSGDILLKLGGSPWQLAALATRLRCAGSHRRTACLSPAPGCESVAWLPLLSDAISDVMPSGVEGAFNPVHTLANAALGMLIFDHLQLDQVAKTAARLGRQTFLFTANTPEHRRRYRITPYPAGNLCGPAGFSTGTTASESGSHNPCLMQLSLLTRGT